MNNVKIKVIDSPTGKGKTTALINLINSGDFEGNKRFLVVTPYNTEVDRICKSTSCISPIGKKSEDIKSLLVNGNNICCTHALCSLFDNETKDILLNNGYSYTLIIDEEPQVIKEAVGLTQQLNVENHLIIERYAHADFKLILDAKLIKINDDTGQISWDYCHEYNNKKRALFTNFRTLTEQADLFKPFDKPFVIGLAKPNIWGCFENVYISSYRVKYSYFYCYCLFYGLNIEWYHIEDNGEITKGYKLEAPRDLNRIKLYDGVTYNLTGYTLTRSWYKTVIKNRDTKALDNIKKSLRGYLRYAISDFKASLFYWTVFKDYKELLTTKGVSAKRWLSCNKKATNDYKDCTVIAVLCDRYPLVDFVNFFSNYDIKLDRNNYRLNELIQFIWRSNIRDTKSVKDINVYIPHNPMRSLFKEWLDVNLKKGQ